MSSLTTSRRSTSARLRSVELPDCFIAASVSAALNAIDRDTVSAKVSRRRLQDKAIRAVEREHGEIDRVVFFETAAFEVLP